LFHGESEALRTDVVVYLPPLCGRLRRCRSSSPSPWSRSPWQFAPPRPGSRRWSSRPRRRPSFGLFSVAGRSARKRVLKQARPATSLRRWGEERAWRRRRCHQGAVRRVVLGRRWLTRSSRERYWSVSVLASQIAEPEVHCQRDQSFHSIWPCHY